MELKGSPLEVLHFNALPDDMGWNQTPYNPPSYLNVSDMFLNDVAHLQRNAILNKNIYIHGV